MAADLDYEDEDASSARWVEVAEVVGLRPYFGGARLAAHLSVSPEMIGADVVVRGRTVIALTVCGREFGMPRGALRV